MLESAARKASHTSTSYAALGVYGGQGELGLLNQFLPTHASIAEKTRATIPMPEVVIRPWVMSLSSIIGYSPRVYARLKAMFVTHSFEGEGKEFANPTNILILKAKKRIEPITNKMARTRFSCDVPHRITKKMNPPPKNTNKISLSIARPPKTTWESTSEAPIYKETSPIIVAKLINITPNTLFIECSLSF